MSHQQITDDLIRGVFERRADRGRTLDVRSAVLATTRATPQQGRWSAGLPRFVDRPRMPRVAAVVLVTIALVGVVVAVSSGGRPAFPAPSPAAVAPPVSPSASPTAEPTPEETPGQPSERLPAGVFESVGFFPSFTYENPAGSRLEPAGSGAIAIFTPGPGDPFGRTQDGGFVPGARGISVSAFNLAHTHPCPQDSNGGSRITLRKEPAAFLEDLRAIGGVGVDPPTATTFDGRPALAAAIDPGRSACGTADFHIPGAEPDYVLLLTPARLIVTQVSGQTVVVHIWATTSEDLEAWLPTATRFVDSIHFAE